MIWPHTDLCTGDQSKSGKITSVGRKSAAGLLQISKDQPETGAGAGAWDSNDRAPLMALTAATWASRPTPGSTVVPSSWTPCTKYRSQLRTYCQNSCALGN